MEESLRQLASCSVCFEFVANQKQLQCQHSLCLKCLQQLVGDKRSMQCPLCKKMTMVHNGGVAKIQDSLLIKQIADLLESYEKTANSKDDIDDSFEDDQMSSKTVKPGTSTSTQTSKAGQNVSGQKDRASNPRRTTKIVKYIDEKLAESVSVMARMLKRHRSEIQSQVTEKKARLESVEGIVDLAVAETKRLCNAKISSLEQCKLAHNDEMKSELEACSEKVKQYESLRRELDPYIKTTAHDYSDEQKIEIRKIRKRLLVLHEDYTSDARTGKKAGEFRKGDTVRLLPKATTLTELLSSWEVSFDSVGIFVKTTEYHDSKMAWVIFPEKNNWVGSADQLIHTRQKANLPFNGDMVRVPMSITDSEHFEGRKHWCPGLLVDVAPDRSTRDGEISDVRALIRYKGRYALEKVPYKNVEFFTGLQFKVGDKVRVNSTIEEPSIGWGKINGSSVGLIKSISDEKQTSDTEVVVEFEEDGDWSGVINDLELWMEPAVGDQVQVKLSVKEPCLKWGGVTHASRGKVEKIKNDRQVGRVAEIRVEIPHGFSAILFKCLLSEIELARYDKDADLSAPLRSIEEEQMEMVLRQYQAARETFRGAMLNELFPDDDSDDDFV